MFLTHACTSRSTVEFAREVAETKAMDDALNRLEGMFTGTDPREEGLAPRRGDTTTKSGSFTQSTTSSNSEVCRVADIINLFLKLLKFLKFS